jgi:hypothetical protein
MYESGSSSKNIFLPQTQDEDSEAEKLSPLLDAATSTDPLPLDSVIVPHGDDLEDDDDLEMKVDVREGEDELATAANSSQGTNIYSHSY